MAGITAVESAPGVAFTDTGAGSFASNAITNFFLPILADARNNSTVLWNYIKDGVYTLDTSGRYIIWPVQFGRNTGHNAIHPGGSLPLPASEQYRTYTSETRTAVARIKVDGETLRRAKTNGGAFVTAVMREADSMVDNITVDMARQIHNDGSGRMGEVRATATGGDTVIQVKFNSAIEGAANLMSGATALVGKPTMYFEVGDRVSFISSTGTLRALTSGGQNAFYVTAVTPTTISIDVTQGTTTAMDVTVFATKPTAGDWIVRASNEVVTDYNSTAYRAEIMGMGGMLSDANVADGLGVSTAGQQTGAQNQTSSATGFQGLDGAVATALPFNVGIVNDNGSSGLRALTEALMQQAVSDAEEINNANIDLCVMPYGTYNSYVKLVLPDRRFNNTTDLKGGHKTIDFNGLPVIKDRFCYPGRVMFLATDIMRRFTVEPLRPLAYQGVTTWERLRDIDAYWTGWVGSENIGALVRNKTGVLLNDLNA